MSLTDTINNTNTQKEKLKTVANNIDNKLVELGGQRATDLADVVNKMEGMVTGNYKKIATLDMDYSVLNGNIATNIKKKIPLTLDFIPKFAFVEFQPKTTHDSFKILNNKLIWDTRFSMLEGTMPPETPVLELKDAILNKDSFQFTFSTEYAAVSWKIKKITFIG